MTEPKIPLPEVLKQWRSHAEREAKLDDLKQAERSPTAFEEPPGSCKWVPFKTATTEGIMRVELDDDVP